MAIIGVELLWGNCCAHVVLLCVPIYVLAYPSVMGRFPYLACVLL
jgi:hypothetical protein